MVTRKEIQESKAFGKVREHRATCPLWQKGYCKDCSPNLVDFANDLIKELAVEEVAVYNFCNDYSEKFKKKLVQQSAERGTQQITPDKLPESAPEIRSLK